MNPLDWLVLGVTIGLVILMGYRIGKRQASEIDYFLGGRRIRGWQIGLSLLANQVSAISLVGAPAFIALRSGGGLRWLQYEMAVPLAMAAIILLLLPLYLRSRSITIYHYLEERFGPRLRLLVSLVFLAGRSLGSGVALLATSYVTAVCLDVSLDSALLAIALVTLIYTTMGGISADIFTDIVQLFILWFSALVCVAILLILLGGPPAAGEAVDPARQAVLVFGTASDFSFWPMLLGGFFLYLSYYGCDQSQAQRLLSTADRSQARRALLINGLLRFPLVASYCLIGYLLIPFLAARPDFAALVSDLPPDYLMPHFFRSFVPTGLLGLVVAGIFAASLSSLDSALNSLSASSWNDILLKLKPAWSSLPDRRKVLISRTMTVCWGGLALGFAFYLSGSGTTVIETVNKIGSAFYGPVAAVFAAGALLPRSRERDALLGLAAGFTGNLYLWLFQAESVSWLWWNLSGFGLTFLLAFLPGLLRTGKKAPLLQRPQPAGGDLRAVSVLLGWFLFILLFLTGLHFLLGA